MAKYCASTALAVNMHLYLTLTNVYRWRHGAAAAAGPLRKIASDGIILMTSGASDGIWPTGTAVPEGGGYRVSGRKSFCSQAPIADVLVTAAVHDDPAEGRGVLMLSIPTKAEGVRIVETWDTMGMRATACHDVELENVRVADAQVVAHRPWGRVDPILHSAIVHFAPLVSSEYHGVAMGARDEAVKIVLRRKRGDGQPLVDDPLIQQQVGLMEHKLRVAWWTLLGALDELGDDYAQDEATVNAVQIAKRRIITDAITVVDLALATVGGSSFFKRSPLERAYRDVRAGEFHPFSPDKALVYSGRFALGQSVETVWYYRLFLSRRCHPMTYMGVALVSLVRGPLGIVAIGVGVPPLSVGAGHLVEPEDAPALLLRFHRRVLQATGGDVSPATTV